jgi:hypothetical protein
MMFIREGSPLGLKIGKEDVKAIQEQIPPPRGYTSPCWRERISIPATLIPAE